MRVFIISPADIATGGTELLQQFARCLTDYGIEAYMVYPEAERAKCPVPESFWKYGVRYVTQYVDSRDSVLVLAETRIDHANLCKKGRVMVWWLSVDNYIRSYKTWIKDDNFDIFHLKQRTNVIHFVQSYYAKDFLEKQMNITEGVHFLKDYINDEITEIGALHGSLYKRGHICLYNPAKGYEKLEPVIKACREDIKWIPLSGYTPGQMAELMCRARVYVDFGPHPGKDRIPREAAVCGCCILTNREGSAAYREDVGIPESYKIEDTADVEMVLEKIYDLTDHYEDRIKDYSDYREAIRREKGEFVEEAQKAVAILEEWIGDTGEGILCPEDAVILEKMLESMDLAVDQMHQLLLEAKTACAQGDGQTMRDKMLTVDYVLQMVRESIYAGV